ncbi:MAG: DsbA family protein [Bacteroidetes bacterium]|nr:DsbA family protein [Bacteroidota bacterium]
MRLALLPLATALAALALVGCKKDDPASTTPTAPPPTSAAVLVADTSAATSACSVEDAEIPNWRTLVHADDPSFGPADAKVTVVEFFEPNCPHCAHLSPTIAAVQEANPDVRFVYKPVVFWRQSTLQMQAILAAHAAGKFKPFVLEQFARTNEQTGLNDSQVRQIATDIGLNGDSLLAAVNAGMYRAKMVGNRDDFTKTGRDNVPLVLINGKPLGGERSTGCFAQQIAAAKS